MNRRDLLKLVLALFPGSRLFPRTGNTAAGGSSASIPGDLSAPVGPWKQIALREQDFEDELGRRPGWDPYTGFCAIVQDHETLEFRRQVVRLDQPADRAEAKRLLRAWCEDLNANPSDVCRRATEQYWIYDRHDELVGWHYDERWRDSDYGGYRALGVGYRSSERLE